MSSLADKITAWLCEGLIDGILKNFNGMFDEVNQRVGEIAGQVGQTPQDWNAGVFSMIRTLSETVVIPIAGMILTFVLCYELIHMIIERNNMHEMDTFIFYKWIFKTYIAAYLLTHTFDIVMGMFGLAQSVINSSTGIITGNLNIDLSMSELRNTLEAMGWGELLALYVESSILKLGMTALSIVIFVTVYGRMLTIYLTISVAPIPFSTLTNREWSSIGNNYLKSVFAMAFQGFFIMVCVAIYAVLLQNASLTGDIHKAIWTCAAYTVLMCFCLMKTDSLAKSVFNAH